MKTTLILCIIVMVGMVAADYTSVTPDGFIPDANVPAVSSVTVLTTDMDNSEGENSYSTVTELEPPLDGFAWTEVNWSHLAWLGGSSLRGLDYCGYSGGYYIMSPRDGWLYIIKMTDGTKYDEIPLAAANGSPYGSYPWSSVNVNDWVDNVIYHSTDLGVTWSTVTNPTGNNGRGMDCDYDGNLVWETYSSSAIYSFTTGSTSGTAYDVSGSIPSQMSGLATFEYNGETWLAVTCYNSPNSYFYQVLPGVLNYMGYCELLYASAFEKSYGITYFPDTDTFFWSFKNNVGNCYLIEMSLTLTGLERSSWGSIKAQF